MEEKKVGVGRKKVERRRRFMARFSFSSLRVRIMLLVLLAVIPALALTLYTGLQQRRLAIINAQEDGIRLARIASIDQERVIEETHQLLATIAQLPSVRESDPAACNKILATLLKKFPFYTNLEVAHRDGDIFCSAIPNTQLFNLSDQVYFQSAIENGDLSVGAYQADPISGVAEIVFAYPALDSTDKIGAVVIAGLDLERLNRLAAAVQLPQGSVLTVTDKGGRILARHPNPMEWIGKVENESTMTVEGSDDVPRLYAITPLHSVGGIIDLRLSIGIPKEIAFAQTNSIMIRNLVVLGLVALLALTAAGVGGDALILRPVNALVESSKRIASGDLKARTGMPPGQRELNQLAEAFDGMAGSLEQRQEEAERRLERVQSLRDIDIAITSSLDLHATLNALLEQVTTQLRVDAADVLLLNPNTRTLEYSAGRGFRTDRFQQTSLKLGQDHAGRAALEQRLIYISNLAEEKGDPSRAPLLEGEEFIAHCSVPLIAKGQAKGVLEIFHRALLDADLEWLEFLEALAGSAAITIDNASLFDALQRSNDALFLAYDATIEGWSRAMDLRDKETEGHTRRVTELTIRLAQVIKMNEEELKHVKRGALLHDMGKMGIPDSILLKPGKLTDEEWEIMRRHPEYAYEMLLPITYLRPALDIPYHHHEKWDGTGYPQGLKGDGIPQSARLFAMVDVWDALRSDRSYRASWPAEKVREHIRSLSGTHFDPRAVELFMELTKVEDNHH